MNEVTSISVALDADARNIRNARQVLRDALVRSDAEHLIDAGTLVVSEVITNAFVHAGTDVRLRVWATSTAVRVEVDDGAEHVPTRRHYSETSGTGRGLQLLDALVNRWGTVTHGTGKTVWFEIGDPATARSLASATQDPAVADDAAELPSAVRVTLRNVPLLMHVAWQEHAATLLREYLLHVLGEDLDILDRHSQASDALSLLNERLPAPELSDEGDALMADAVGPRVIA